jgi:5-methyltetrahydrofolate--homocysteine methyltransferase
MGGTSSYDLKSLIDMLLDFKGEKIPEFCKRRLEEGVDPYQVFKELSRGLEEIGRGYERGRYFTSDLIVSGSNMKKAIEYLRPHLSRGIESPTRGRVVLGTVKGDIHDIGKSILSILLQATGFEVIDLGIDVDEENFIKAVKETQPDILAMSALLTSTMPYMEKVIRALEEKGLRRRVKVIVGGRPVTREFAEEIGADAYAEDAVEGVKRCLELLGEGDEDIHHLCRASR